MFNYISGLKSLVSIILLYGAYRICFSRRYVPLPPGPKGLPILGNALEVPPDYHWLFYSRLRKQFGDLVTLMVFGKPMVIVSTRKDTLELTVMKHDLYAERPDFFSWDASGWAELTALHNGPYWKEHRRLLSRLLGSRLLIQRFYGIQLLAVRKLMRSILRDPEDLDHHIRYTAGSMILKITYGYDAQDGHDPLIEKVDEAMAQFSELLKSGKYLVDFLPWLRHFPEWFPGAGWKKTIRHYRETLEEMKTMPFNFVREQMEAGTAAPSYVSSLLDSEELSPEKEYTIKCSAAAIYSGGADTSVSQIHSFFVLMMLKPDIQRKAQAEINAIVGNERLPDPSDRERLPYVEAVLKEASRYHVVIPSGAPRRALKDDFHAGYFIPKDTVIMPNIWEMCHDPEVYKDPFEFNPDRFLGGSPEPHPHEFIFGFGRRVCPGQYLADASIWLSCVMALALFDIKPTEGSPTELSLAEGGLSTGDAISRPSPFKSNIKPRSAKAEALILSIDEEA